MNNKLRTNKAFTLIELVVAIGILAMVSSFAGVIFKVSIDSQRTGLANAEIMQKLRAITNQLDKDFSGLRKNGEIFVVWTRSYDPDLQRYVRFDRIMFFANGDFQSYGMNPPVRGNIARISYMLAMRRGEPPEPAPQQEQEERILARTQHILTADSDLDDFLASELDEDLLDGWHNQYEYDRTSLLEWKNIPWIDPANPDKLNKPNILSAIVDIKVTSTVPDNFVIGSRIDPTDSTSIHNLLCQGVGEFKIQGWYTPGRRWVPEVDVERGIDDFDLDDPTGERVPGVLYHPFYGGVILGGEFADMSFLELLNQEHFGEIPGLGRALKFTFTLYDSKGIIKDGRTFTHIVYLGD